MAKYLKPLDDVPVFHAEIVERSFRIFQYLASTDDHELSASRPVQKLCTDHGLAASHYVLSVPQSISVVLAVLPTSEEDRQLLMKL